MKTQNRLPYLALLAGLVALLAVPSQGAIQYADSAAYATPTWDNGFSFQWGNASGGPYSSPWTSGNDAVFEGTAGLVTIGSGGVTANNLYFPGVTGYIITNSSGSVLTLSGSIITNGPGVNSTIAAVITGNAGLNVDGGGTLNLSALNSFVGQTYVGNNYSNNTLNISGRLTGANAAGNFFIGSQSISGSGHNSVDISGVGNLLNGSQTVRIGGNSIAFWLGGSDGNPSPRNSLTVRNGASFRSDGGNGTTNSKMGSNAGSTNNSMTVTGTNAITGDKSTFSHSGQRFYVGQFGSANTLTVSDGGQALLRVFHVGAGGHNNTATITGPRSFLSVTEDMFIGNGDNGTNNSVTVSDGGWLRSRTRNGRVEMSLIIGSNDGANNNSFTVTGAGTTWTNDGYSVMIGGSGYTTAPAFTPRNATGNSLNVIGGASATINTGVILSGVNSAFNLGDGTGISTASVSSNTLSSVSIPGVSNSVPDARLNINSGRLIANNDFELVSGPGKVQLNGPAWFSTTFAGSTISSEITGGGSLTKEGTGRLLLTVSNSFSGLTTVSNGTLHAAVTNSLGTGDLNIISGATVEVPAGVMVAVAALSFDGVVQSPGTYGATGSGANIINDTYFLGTGIVNVLGGTVLPLRITSSIYDANNDQLILKWDSSPGAVYTIENTQNLVDWDNLTTGISSGGITTTRLIDFPQPGTFYRIRKE